MKKSFFKNSFILYTCSFLIVLPIVFLVFLSAGRTFVWRLDGLDQHYPALLYYGKMLRGLFSGNGFPMVDFSVGTGFDTITTLHYYVLGDPLALLSVFMNEANGPYLYEFLILLRFYLAGLSFLLFMKYVKKDGQAAVLGALIYAFSEYSLYASIKHPFFMNPMIYLPLILIGVEQVLKKKKPYLLVIMAFVSTISNFYFFYTLTIITVLYVIFRYAAVYRVKYRNAFTGLLITGWQTGRYYLLGTAMAGAVFIPVLYAFSRNGRLNVRPGMVSGSIFLYEPKYYLTFVQGLFAPGVSPGYWTLLSFPVIMTAVLAVLFRRKKHRQLQVSILLVCAALCIPAFGYFMNGFSYDSNRWGFVIGLLAAAAFTYTYEDLFRFEKKDGIVLLSGIGIMAVLAFAFPSKQIVKITCAAVLLVALILFLLQTDAFRKRPGFSRGVVFALVIVSLGFNGYGLYSARFGDYAKEYLKMDAVISRSDGGELDLLQYIEDDSFYRVETYGEKALNTSLTQDYQGVSGYFSLTDGNVTAYLKGLEVLDQRTASRFDSLDGRTILDTLSGVKYFLTTKISAVPYGYSFVKELEQDTHTYYLFRNDSALPLGYTYKKYILRQDYDRLDALEKQDVLLYAAVLDQSTEYAKELDAAGTGSGIREIPVKAIPGANVLMDGNQIHIRKDDAKIMLEFDSAPNTEVYIRLEGIGILDKKSIMTNLVVKTDSGLKRTVNIRSPYNNSYYGKEEYLINLGYSVSGEKKAVITFPDSINFKIGSISAYSVDMSRYADQVKELNQSVLANIVQSDNRIEGDAVLEAKGVMVFTIPYSKGWSATVDGVKTDLKAANVMYMALPLDAGTHHIVLQYETPYLKTGVCVSLAAVLIFAAASVYSRRKKACVP
jgi:uncharacterized membrane protein YfhO